MPDTMVGSTIAVFLEGARAVLAAVATPEVGQSWDRPSVLEDQTVGSLVGHLARGAVWVVDDYLGDDEPPGPVTFQSADAYYAHLADHLGAEDHAAIRRRAADIASPGHAAVVSDLRGRLERLEPRLAAAGPEHRLAVVGGAVMRLGDYLATRIVEQVVHLDDLARSVAVDLAPTPERCVQTALAVGTAIGRRRFGDAAMVRALYRRTDASPLPVL